MQITNRLLWGKLMCEYSVVLIYVVVGLVSAITSDFIFSSSFLTAHFPCLLLILYFFFMLKLQGIQQPGSDLVACHIPRRIQIRGPPLYRSGYL